VTPLRVAFDMTFPDRNPAGSGVYATELLNEMSKREDVSITTMTSGRSGFPRTVRWLTYGARRAARGVQLVHCPAFVAPWRFGVPFVLTVHDMSTQKFPEDHPLEWRSYARFFLPERARAASRVITGTEYSRQEIAKELGLRPENIAVTPYGVAERFSRTPAPRAPAGEKPLLLFPGAPTRRKNLELVLRALSEAADASVLRRARLAISGATAAQFPHQQEKIKMLDLENRVEWLGKVPAENMPSLILSADLVVYPSLHEGFGFPALEAMASGTPVLASNAACLPEVLGDGALMVDPTNLRAFITGAESLLEKPELRARLIEKGRAHAAHFTWRRCADLTVEVYKEAAPP
jgi:glycosyltransferase involved in cell wall biosynthesis